MATKRWKSAVRRSPWFWTIPAEAVFGFSVLAILLHYRSVWLSFDQSRREGHRDYPTSSTPSFKPCPTLVFGEWSTSCTFSFTLLTKAGERGGGCLDRWTWPRPLFFTWRGKTLEESYYCERTFPFADRNSHTWYLSPWTENSFFRISKTCSPCHSRRQLQDPL